MVFGVFDGLHVGHQFFLIEASALGEIVVVVARDRTVSELKHKKSRHDQANRMAAVQNFMPDATVVLGDAQQGKYDVIKEHHPDMICLGHDQQALGEDVQKKFPDITITYLAKHV